MNVHVKRGLLLAPPAVLATIVGGAMLGGSSPRVTARNLDHFTYECRVPGPMCTTTVRYRLRGVGDAEPAVRISLPATMLYMYIQRPERVWGRHDTHRMHGSGDVNGADLAVPLGAWGPCK